MEEQHLLNKLKLLSKDNLEALIIKHVAQNENFPKIQEKLQIRYKDGVFEINDNLSFIPSPKTDNLIDNLKDDALKRIFKGLPLEKNDEKEKKPIGGEVTISVDNFHCYTTRRSNRYRNVKVYGSDEKEWRIGHILFAWLVDRYLYRIKFSSEEKRMMFFNHAPMSNEPKYKKKEKIRNHYYYEDMLKRYINMKLFRTFTYSVTLIYMGDKTPIGTLIQLCTDNKQYGFNVFAPNVNFDE